MRLRSKANKDGFDCGVDGNPYEQPMYEPLVYRDSQLYYGNLDRAANEYLEIKPTQFDPSYDYPILNPGSDAAIDSPDQIDGNDYIPRQSI